jgi:hypothetical protein
VFDAFKQDNLDTFHNSENNVRQPNGSCPDARPVSYKILSAWLPRVLLDESKWMLKQINVRFAQEYVVFVS